MFQSINAPVLLRNLSVYTVGIAATVAGAVGIVDAIALPVAVSWLLFAGGIAAVIFVHEYFDGPL